MVQVRQRFRHRKRDLLIVICGGLMATWPAAARKFYADDPLWREPPPIPVKQAAKRDINEQYEFFLNTFHEPGKQERQEGTVPRAENVNTMDEVPDSAWFTNRYGSPESMPHQKMTLEDLVRGPGDSMRPAMDGPWTVLSGKNGGVTPGLVIRDSKGRKFVLKFDPLSNPEMASAVDVIGSKFFYALGFNVPENHIVNFTRAQLTLTPKSRFKNFYGHEREMTERDLTDQLAKTPRDREGRYRAMASFFIPGDILGPFRFTGTRADDPNDIVRHENHRELRGLYAMAAWLNHTDIKSGNTLDSLVDDGGVRVVRHYLVDFGAIMGSASVSAKEAADGQLYMFDLKPAAVQFLTLGLDLRPWDLYRFPDLPEVGRFAAETFKPEDWKPNFPNVAFDLRLPGDLFWAAKRVMAFTDSDIRAIVATGEYSDSRALDWNTKTLIARRDMIGRAFLTAGVPLDNFRIRAGRLEFDDLAERYGFSPVRQWAIHWSKFDNETERGTALAVESGPAIPAVVSTARLGEYFAAEITGRETGSVTVYLRRGRDGLEVAGIDRKW